MAAREALRRQVYGLYVIVDPQVSAGREVLDIARAALRGGTHMLQLRDKLHDKGVVLPLARELVALCREFDALFIVNDDADVALLSEAHGLHVGQQDLPVAEARQVLKPEQLVGRSNATLAEALESERQGADYIAVGSIFPTATKERTRPAGLDTLKQVSQAVRAPVVAIGGIQEQHIGQVVQAGAHAVCVVSAVGLAADPETATRCLVQRIHEAGGKA